MNLLSIFISEEIKENTIGFWRGLLIPLGVGLGFPLILFRNIDTIDNLEYKYTDQIFGGLVALFVLIIWPLISWLQMKRAEKLGKFHYKNGSLMSLKLYLAMLAYFAFGIMVGQFFGE